MINEERMKLLRRLSLPNREVLNTTRPVKFEGSSNRIELLEQWTAPGAMSVAKSRKER